MNVLMVGTKTWKIWVPMAGSLSMIAVDKCEFLGNVHRLSRLVYSVQNVSLLPMISFKSIPIIKKTRQEFRQLKSYVPFHNAVPTAG